MNRITSLSWHFLCRIFPRTAVRIQYRHIVGRNINLSNPKDLNEKINYLKFHADLGEWARLTDKYTVREYVKERGLGDILVPLYGKYGSGEELIDDWNNLPDSFIIKSNHGCGMVRLVNDKHSVNLSEIRKETAEWLKKKFGVVTNEPHYKLINPCIIVEKLLEDYSMQSYSQSMIDYKVWCFDGKPYSILVVVNRDYQTGSYQLDTYDVHWKRIDGALTGVHGIPPLLPKPKNFENLLECASVLSKGHKQVRVDLYDIDGKIFFGEMTFTSQGGYMNYYTSEFLLRMGQEFSV